MGRGRAKAKQTKVARRLKYTTTGTDLDRLKEELSAGGGLSSTVNEPDDDHAAYDAGRRQYADNADPLVEGPLQLVRGHPAAAFDQPEDRRHNPRRAVHDRGQAVRDHAGHVGREPAAGYVRERMHIGLRRQREAGA